MHPALQFGPLPSFRPLELLRPYVRQPDHPFVDHQHTALADGAHRELVLDGDPDLADDDDVERHPEGACHLRRDRDTPAG